MVLGVRPVCPAAAVCISSVLPTHGPLQYVRINKGRECSLDKKTCLYSDLLKRCLKQKRNITGFLPDTPVFFMIKTCVMR